LISLFADQRNFRGRTPSREAFCHRWRSDILQARPRPSEILRGLTSTSTMEVDGTPEDRSGSSTRRRRICDSASVRGCDVRNLSEFPGEAEVLLLHGTPLIVTGVERETEHIWMVSADLDPPALREYFRIPDDAIA
jgi:hypothetical protein